MKKKILGIGCAVLMGCILVGCLVIYLLFSFLTGWLEEDEDNPLAGKDTDERIIMCLEKAYPENGFETVKPYGEYDGEYYAIYRDEKGLEFRVGQLYNNSSHFRCHDEYFQEILVRQGYIEKAIEIAEVNGYKIDYDLINGQIALDTAVEGDDVEAIEVARMIKDIMNSVETPRIERPVNTEFSTGEVNYYTLSKLDCIHYHVRSKKGEGFTSFPIFFADKELDEEVMAEDIQAELELAYEMLEE